MEPAEHPLPPEGSIEDVAARLALWGRRAPRGLARVEYTSEFSRAAVVTRMRELLEPHGVPLHELALPLHQCPEEIVRFLREELANLDPGVVSVTGFATAFPEGVPLVDPLRVLNFHREVLADFPLCQVWWMPPYFAHQFMQAIPDLNSWFVQRMELIGENHPDASTEMARSFSLMAYSRSLSKAQAKADDLRIAVKEDASLSRRIELAGQIIVDVNGLPGNSVSGFAKVFLDALADMGLNLDRTCKDPHELVLRIDSDMQAQGDSLSLDTIGHLSRICSVGGEGELAISLAIAGYERSIAQYGGTHEKAVLHLLWLASCLLTNGKCETSAEYLIRGIEQVKRSDAMSSDVAILEAFLARVYVALHQPKLVVDLLQNASERLADKKLYEVDALLSGDLGSAYLELGDFEHARVHLEKAILFYEDYPKSPSLLISWMLDIAIACERLGMLDEAERYYERCLNIDGSSNANARKYVETAIRNLAALLRTTGRDARASTLLAQLPVLAQKPQ